MNTNKLTFTNFSKAEKTIINEFLKRDDLVFTKVDKGGATVKLVVENYIEKENKELNNENYHKKFNHDPTQEHTKTVNDIIEIFQPQQALLKNICYNLKTKLQQHTKVLICILFNYLINI